MIGKVSHGGARAGSGRKKLHGRKATQGVNVILAKSTIKEIDRLARGEEISRAEAIRQAVDAWLAK